MEPTFEFDKWTPEQIALYQQFRRKKEAEGNHGAKSAVRVLSVGHKRHFCLGNGKFQVTQHQS